MAQREEVEKQMIRYLLCKRVGEGYRVEDEVETFVREGLLLEEVVSILGGKTTYSDEPIEIVKIVKVDLSRMEMSKLMPVLEDMRIKLVEDLPDAPESDMF